MNALDVIMDKSELIGANKPIYKEFFLIGLLYIFLQGIHLKNNLVSVANEHLCRNHYVFM